MSGCPAHLAADSKNASGAALAAHLASAAEPVLGMIFPPANDPVPPEAKLLYPHGVTFDRRGG
jgi:hypothetical protein